MKSILLISLHFIDKISKIVERKYIAQSLPTHYGTIWHIKMITQGEKEETICLKSHRKPWLGYHFYDR